MYELKTTAMFGLRRQIFVTFLVLFVSGQYVQYDLGKRKRFKVEDGFKLSCRPDEDPFDTSKIPLRKRNQKGSSAIGQKRGNRPHTSKQDKPGPSSDLLDSFPTNSERETNEDNCEKIAAEVSAIEIYQQLLKCGQIHVIDETLTSFVIPDFEEKGSKLQVDEYCIVSRHPKSFAGEHQWLYSCSCDLDRKKIFESLNDCVVTSFNEFSSAFEHCIHCKAVSCIMNGVDGLYAISPEIYSDHDYTTRKNIELEMKDVFPLGKHTICVNASQSPGIVKFINSYLRCITCQSASCTHTSIVEDLIKDVVNEENLESQPDEVLQWLLSHTEKKNSNTYKPKVVSWKKIPFHYPDELSELLNKQSDERFHNWQCSLNKPDICETCFGESFKQCCKTVDIISQSFIHPFKVNTWKCCGCGLETNFDGQEYGIINMGNYCISYEVLRRFLFYFLQGKSTMYTEYIVMRQMLLDHGVIQVDAHFSYQKLQYAWYGFIDLLDIDFNQGFTCSECGPEPSICVMDATTLSFRKRMISWDILFNVIQKPKQKPSKGR